MSDQATDLRKLIRSDEGPTLSESSTRIVAVTGGKPGVGSTTLATNLAIQLSQFGERVLLVDTVLTDGDVPSLCDAKPKSCLSEAILAGEAIQALVVDGVAGTSVLASTDSSQDLPCLGNADELRFMGQLRDLARQYDTVIVDTGNGIRSLTRVLWRNADRVLVVSTSDSIAVMDGYAIIKTLADSRQTVPIGAVTNQASRQVAQDVYGRLRAACDRFLGLEIEQAGCVPTDTMLSVAARMETPVVLQAPTSSAAQAIAALANGIRKNPSKTQLRAAS